MILKKNKLKRCLKFFTTIVLIINYSPAFSQCKIAGTIKTENNQAIPFVNIFITPENNQEIIAFCSSDENGNYELKTNKIGKLDLNFTALSFKKQIITIDIKAEDKGITKNIVLASQPLVLNEIIISGDKSITLKKDTIIFNASSFLQGNEHVVEDLLKKLPGLSVSKEGAITVGNQEVEKVMIEGDDFFEKGYKMLTKNMPVSPVNKIELVRHYSNNKLLNGIEKTDKVALNIKLKDNAKQQWFGNLSWGYGLDADVNNHYDIRNNLMNFSKKNKFYFFTNLNNTGDNYDGYIENLIHQFNTDDEANMGNEQSACSFLSLNGYTPNLDSKRVNFNSSKIVSLNNIYDLSPKIKIKFIGLLNSEKNDFYRNNYQIYKSENISFTNTEDFKLTTNEFTGFGKLDFNYDISKTKTLQITGKFNSTNSNNNSNIVFNNDSIDEGLVSNNILIDNKIVFSNKFSKNKAFTFTGRYINDKTPQSYTSNKFIYSELFQLNADNVVQSSNNKMEFFGFEGFLIDRKKNGNLLEIQLGNQYRKDSLLSQFEIKKGNDILEKPLNYNNNLLYLTNDVYVKAKYLFKLNNIGLQTELGIHQLLNKLEMLNNSQSESPFFINPSLNIFWDIKDKHRISTSYSYSTKNSELKDVYSQYLQTDLYSFSKGTGSFNQLIESSTALNYTYGNWGEKFFANALVLYNRNHNFISTNTIVTQNYLQSEKIIINGRNYFLFSLSVNRYFKIILSNLKLNFDITESDYKSKINNSELRSVNSNDLNCGFELRSGFKGLFNYHIGSKWSYNQTLTTEVNSYTENKIFFDFYFNIRNKINITSKNEVYNFQNKTNGNNTYFFSDLEARYIILDNKLTLSLAGQNLFNTKTFLNYSINDISISKTEYKLQPRIVLLKIEYRF